MRVVAQMSSCGLLFGEPAGIDLEGCAEISLGDKIVIDRAKG
jgi:hypothetical protein